MDLTRGSWIWWYKWLAQIWVWNFWPTKLVSTDPSHPWVHSCLALTAAAGLRLEGGGGARKEGRDTGRSALSNADEDGGVGPIMWMSGWVEGIWSIAFFCLCSGGWLDPEELVGQEPYLFCSNKSCLNGTFCLNTLLSVWTVFEHPATMKYVPK